MKLPKLRLKRVCCEPRRDDKNRKNYKVSPRLRSMPPDQRLSYLLRDFLQRPHYPYTQKYHYEKHDSKPE